MDVYKTIAKLIVHSLFTKLFSRSLRYFFLFSAIRNAVGILSNKISPLREDYYIHGSTKLNPFVCKKPTKNNFGEQNDQDEILYTF